jgi:hypothetical protein
LSETTLYFFCGTLVLVSVLYSCVGQAGASGYIASMALFGLAPAAIKPTALVLNVLVSLIVSRLKCRQTTLARRFPELTKIIKDRYQQYYAIRKEVRAMLFRTLVRTAVIDLHKAGFYPSQSRIRQALPDCVDMREPVAYTAWRQAVAELNISREKAYRALI